MAVPTARARLPIESSRPAGGRNASVQETVTIEVIVSRRVLARILRLWSGVTAKPLAIGLALTLGASTAVSPRALAEGDERLTCIVSWPEVRYRNYGYDQIVHLRSRCRLNAFCEVSSDVTPKPVEVAIAPRDRRDVLLFRGSPTRQFTARVECRFRRE